jgi:uncharacterized DUF497 family protein
MKYVFDPAKDAINQTKHGVSLALAEILFAGSHATTTMIGSITGKFGRLPLA